MQMERILDRVRKTLNLASNNPSAEEAQAAMLKAQELLAKYGLSMEDIPSDEPKEKEVVDEIATDGRTWWERRLSGIIGMNFRCTPYFIRSVGIYFIGLKEDVEIAKEVFQFAREAIRKNWRRYRKRNGLKGEDLKGVMADYVGGFLNGLTDKFKEQVDRNNWGLVLVQDALVVAAVEQKNLRRGKATRVHARGDAAARAQGYTDGKNFSGPQAQRKQVRG